MDDKQCNKDDLLAEGLEKESVGQQKIIVFQQNGSGTKKIEGIRKYGKGLFNLEIVSIDVSLPPVLDDTGEYIPKKIDADLVLDYLKHQDLSYDLVSTCRDLKIPAVASGKKFRIKGVSTPPT